MTSLKRETAEEAEARLAKEDRPPELKKKGHQKQFEINAGRGKKSRRS